MKIGLKLILGFLSIIFFFGAFEVYVYSANRRVAKDVVNFERQYQLVLTRNIPEADLAMQMQHNLEKTRRALHGYILGHAEDRQNLLDNIEEFDGYQEELAALLKTMKIIRPETEKNIKDFEDIIKLHERFRVSVNKMIELMDAGEKEGAIRFLNEEIEIEIKKMQKLVIMFAKRAKIDMRDRSEAAGELAHGINIRFSGVEKLMLIVFLIGMASVAVLGFFAVNIITVPIIKLKNGVVEISKGKLDVRVEIKSKDEMGELAASFNKMAEDLKKSKQEIGDYNKNLEKKVIERTEELRASNEELASINNKLIQANENLYASAKELRVTNEETQKIRESIEKKALQFEKFNKIAVSRELKMRELKEKIAELEGKLKSRE